MNSQTQGLNNVRWEVRWDSCLLFPRPLQSTQNPVRSEGEETHLRKIVFEKVRICLLVIDRQGKRKNLAKSEFTYSLLSVYHSCKNLSGSHTEIFAVVTHCAMKESHL